MSVDPRCKLTQSSRKVRCDMANPCLTCESRSFECTYSQARKKRGPMGRRIEHLHQMQAKRQNMSTPSMTSPVQDSPLALTENLDMERFSTVGSANGDTVHSNPSTLTNVNMDPRLSTWSASQQHAHATQLATGNQSSVQAYSADFLLPSLPMDSPPDAYNLFASMPEPDTPRSQSLEFWPRSINQETLLPWIDVYFKRLHPTIPLLNRTMIYQEMLMRRHHIDRQFGAMLLALCAFAMTQPVQIHEVATAPSRSAQARMLLEESVRMRMTVDFGEDSSIHMVLASFFIFACLFGSGQHSAARHRLREAVDLADSLGLHLPHAYDGLDTDAREQWLRTYLVLSVTER